MTTKLTAVLLFSSVMVNSFAAPPASFSRPSIPTPRPVPSYRAPIPTQPPKPAVPTPKPEVRAPAAVHQNSIGSSYGPLLGIIFGMAVGSAAARVNTPEPPASSASSPKIISQ